MVNINPLHNEEEIRTDQSQENLKPTVPTQTQTQSNPTETTSAIEDKLNIVKSPQNIPSTTIQNETTTQTSGLKTTSNTPNPASIYPEPLSFSEREKENENLYKNSSRTPISALIVAGIVLLASIYVAYEFFKSVIVDSDSTSFSISRYSLDSIWGWVFSVIAVLQLIAVIYAALRLWKGSLAGLAFLSGISLLYINQFLLTAILGVYWFYNASSYYGSSTRSIPFEYYAVIGISVVYFFAMIDCWTRARKYLH